MTSDEDAFPRRVEEACLNGWPALRQIVHGGLLLRFSDGYTRRSNSVSVIGPLWRDPDEAIAFCETAYRAANLSVIFRLSSAWNVGLAAALDRAGYGPPEDETLILCGRLASNASSDSTSVLPRPGAAWLDALARIQSQNAEARSIHRSIVRALAVPAGFASVRIDGEIVAVAFGAAHDGIVCVNSVATDPRFRRRGFARAAIDAVLAWAGRSAGATRACVPVVADNAPAIALYRQLGFTHEVSRYHYRRHLS